MLREIKHRFSFMEGNLMILTIRQIIGMFFRRMVLSYASLFVYAVGGNSSQIGGAFRVKTNISGIGAGETEEIIHQNDDYRR